jgi:hypothetical protein
VVLHRRRAFNGENLRQGRKTPTRVPQQRGVVGAINAFN